MDDSKAEAQSDVFLGDLASLDGLDGLDEFDNFTPVDFIDESGNPSDLGKNVARAVFPSDTRRSPKAELPKSKTVLTKRSSADKSPTPTSPSPNSAAARTAAANFVKTQLAKAAGNVTAQQSPPTPTLPETGGGGAPSKPQAQRRNSTKYSFPERVFEMLEEEDATQKSPPIISWLPHGRAFIVNDPNQFAETILPKYFTNIKRLSSFRRQLNIHGFRQLTKGVDSGAYCHDLFLRGHFHLCSGILNLRRKPQFDPNNEPNFYKMPPIGKKPTPSPGVREGVTANKADAEGVVGDKSKEEGDAEKAQNGSMANKLRDINIEDYPMPPKLRGPTTMYSSHPLDQVTFFIPLSMLYG